MNRKALYVFILIFSFSWHAESKNSNNTFYNKSNGSKIELLGSDIYTTSLEILIEEYKPKLWK